MDDFNKGWWNCFLSYTDTISFRVNARDLAFEQMSSAGVKKEEIDFIFKNKDEFIINNSTFNIIFEFRNDTKR